jgi:hypothetical protein
MKGNKQATDSVGGFGHCPEKKVLLLAIPKLGTKG